MASVEDVPVACTVPELVSTFPVVHDVPAWHVAGGATKTHSSVEVSDDDG